MKVIVIRADVSGLSQKIFLPIQHQLSPVFPITFVMIREAFNRLNIQNYTTESHFPITIVAEEVINYRQKIRYFYKYG